MLDILKEFFLPVPFSRKGFLSAEELYRSVIASFGAGNLAGLFLVLLHSIQNAQLFPMPIVGSMATMLVTLVVELGRRLDHGTAPFA